MKYLPRWSMSVWALLALLAGSSVACLSPAWSADQKPLVINPTTGKTEQMQTGNNLLIPGTSTLTVSSLTAGRVPYMGTAGLFIDSSNITTTGSTIRLGGSALSFQGLTVTPNLSGSTTQQGVNASPTFGSDATSGRGVTAKITTTAASFTLGAGYGFYLANPTIGAGSAITTHIGYYCEPLSGAGSNYAFYSGGAGLFAISDTTSSTASTNGAFVVGSGAASGQVGIGGGNISAGGQITATIAGGGIRIKEGTNAKMGAATLVGGTVTVNTTAVTASSRIYLTSQADGGTPGFQRVSARSAATSFTITSSSGTDTSTVAWMIVEPAP